MKMLRGGACAALPRVRVALEGASSDRQRREERLHLKQRGVSEQSGHGRSGVGDTAQNKAANKAEMR